MKPTIMALLTLSLLAISGPAQAGPPRTLIYEGKLTTEKGNPIGGIFKMRFSLVRASNTKATLWSEEMYVAVDRGKYSIELGKSRPIPAKLSLDDLLLAVAVDGQEVQRESVDPSWESGASSTADTNTGGTCGSCTKAEVAMNAQRLDGLNLKQLKTVVAKGIIPGKTQRLTNSHGAVEGAPFKLECPPGHVAGGIQGTADDSIRSLSVICRPLEAR